MGRAGGRQGQVRLADVAAELGVSAMTVSNAFNRPEQLSAALRVRVLEAATRLGYHGPRPAGRLLRTGRAGAIALVNPDPLGHLLDDPAAVAFMRGVAGLCQERQQGLLIVAAAVGHAAPAAIESAAVDGFILYTAPASGPVVSRVAARGLPMVAVDMAPVAGAVPVGIADREAARLAAEHVLRLGHRRLAIVALDAQPDGHAGPAAPARLAGATVHVTRQRYLGYRDALTAAGVEPESVPIIEIPGIDAGLAAHHARCLWTECRNVPTAVLCMSDALAISVLRGAAGIGLAAPADLSIVGFDDVPMAAAMELSTVRQPLRRKGELAAQLLLDGREVETPPTPLPVELVPRRSSGPAPSG